MSHIRNPIAGDSMYGGKPVSELSLTGQGSAEPFLTHQALHAWKIAFKHPITVAPMEIEAPFHGPFKKLVTLLREVRRA
jgi:23S rRNA pseudouridine1911/1915/1917 synthase